MRGGRAEESWAIAVGGQGAISFMPDSDVTGSGVFPLEKMVQ